MSKGIVVFAQNSNLCNYVDQACLLALSLHKTNKETPISIITDDPVPNHFKILFDKIIPIPFEDNAVKSDWKIENRWKIYHASPYNKTLVLDSDMLVLQNIDSWWKVLENYKLFFTSSVRTYRNETVTSDYYRKVFTANNLPNLYSGLHYFEKSDFALQFYKWLELVVNNWQLFYGNFSKEHYPGRCSIDVSAAIVAKILDCEQEITNPKLPYPTFTHMKSYVQNWNTCKESWLDSIQFYFDEECNLKIGNHLQTGIFHYTENNFYSQHVVDTYRTFLNV